MEKVKFIDPETKEEIEFFCLDQTQINNQNYLLVTEDEEGDSTAYILKETSAEGEEVVYDMVEDEQEMEALAKVFAELVEDVELEY